MSLDFAEKLSHTENVGTVGMSEIPTVGKLVAPFGLLWLGQF